jgi:coenzyme F420-reducing hydrogenase beta subunit
METDDEGFLYPSVGDGCTGCSRCSHVCPILTPRPFHPAPETVLAAWLTQNEARLGSSSGGFFRVLVRYTLERGGMVFGATFGKEFRLAHRGAETERDCEAFYGSKYLQSGTGLSFREAGEALDAGRWVLYSGTPCQIAGLYSYLGGDRETLITCEVVCNGVPSPEVFARYLSHLENQYRAKAVSVRFKDKVKGWHDPCFTVAFDNGKRYSKPVCDTAFGHGFGATLFLRPACGTCPYARAERAADFTLADFWGLRPPLPEGAEKGVSLVLVNSEKAAGLELPPLYQSETRAYAEAAAGNARLSRPLKHNPRRGAFFEVYQAQPFHKALAFMFPLHKKVGRSMKKRLRSLLRR